MRKGLDLLCRKSQGVDLERVRTNFKSDFVQSSYDEIEFLKRHGEWEDIPFILKLEKSYDSRRNGLNFLSTDDNWSKYVGGAIYNIGKDRPDDLLNIAMPSNILADVIKQFTPARLLDISHETLFKLLNHEHDKVRKYVSLKIIQAMSKTKVGKLLYEYLEDQNYRYYNVIFWLDFGISVPKRVVNSSVNLIFQET